MLDTILICGVLVLASAPSSGHYFKPVERSCIHAWLPFGTRMEVCRSARCVTCRVNKRPVVREE